MVLTSVRTSPVWFGPGLSLGAQVVIRSCGNSGTTTVELEFLHWAKALRGVHSAGRGTAGRELELESKVRNTLQISAKLIYDV